jgi:hypothetical protein
MILPPESQCLNSRYNTMFGISLAWASKSSSTLSIMTSLGTGSLSTR